MAQEMTRLHRQATEYLEYLLDQREQLLMDSETYNDLISCIVGHAQRMREQAPKDATAAKVSKRRNGEDVDIVIVGCFWAVKSTKCILCWLSLLVRLLI